jgi:manganese-dependent inorganic pyrophosphatase
VVGVEDAEIVGILDHHKLNFSYSQPIAVYIQPWGSSCSIIAGLMKYSGMEIPARLAGLMLSAALVDTVITKSPTCTDKDVGIIKMLAGQAGVDDWQAYGMEIFKVRSSVGELGADEIIQGDFKDFNFVSGKFGIGQVETVDLGEFAGRYDELLEGLDKLRQEGGYHSTILFITDILKEGSRFLVSSSDMERVGKAFGVKFENSQAYLEGVMSRKKQVTPKLAEEFDK